jgi:hypothetical protein
VGGCTSGGRELYSHKYDVTGDTLAIPEISLRIADIAGWAMSLLGATNALPIRNGNALGPLIDDQVACQLVSDAMRGAQMPRVASMATRVRAQGSSSRPQRS